MAKVVHCGKVNPESGCKHVVRGETEEELLRNVAAHAKEHGIVAVTPELVAKVKGFIEDE